MTTAAIERSNSPPIRGSVAASATNTTVTWLMHRLGGSEAGHAGARLERVEPLAAGGRLLLLRSRVRATRAGDARDHAGDGLDWRFVALAA